MNVARQENKLLTDEELWEIPEVPGKRFGLVGRVLVEAPGAELQHGKLTIALVRLLGPFVSDRKRGAVFADGVGYAIQRGPDQLRIPDVSFTAASHISDEGLLEGFWYGTPYLAVEIVSPNDRATDVDEKVVGHPQAGAQLVWVLWPRRRGGNARDLKPDEELTGGAILPGFRVKVSESFSGQSNSKARALRDYTPRSNQVALQLQPS